MAQTVTRATARPAATRPWAGYAMVAFAAVLFAFNGTVSKLVLQAGLDAQRLTELRSTGALAGLLVLAVIVGPRRLRVSRGELPLLALYGVVGFAIVQWLYFVAIGRLPVGIGLLFEFTAPLLVALWARFGQRQQVRRRVWVALALCLAGLGCVAEVWGDSRLDGIGVVAGLTCAVALAAYYVLGERVAGVRDPLSATTWAFVFAALFWAIAQPWWSFPFEVLGDTAEASGGGPTAPVWLLSGYVIGAGTIAPFLLVLGALRHLPATTVGIVGMVEPVLASLVAWALIDEALNPFQLLGGAIVLIGIVLAQTARPQPAEAPAELPPT
jgi:drug/metabolite transporter (DMT)-like permease